MDRLKAIFNARETLFTILLIQFCLVCLSVNLSLTKEWTGPNIAASLGAGILLVAWLCWVTYVLITKKQVTPMTGKAKQVTETCDRVLFIYWWIVFMFPVTASRWMILVALAAVAGCMTYATLTTTAKANS